jgi:two-component system chemotaxis sensor kinase CheA
LPAAVCLDQMPQQLTVGARHLRFDYKPIGAEDNFEKLVVVVSDATAVVERARAQQEEQDILELSSRLIRDRKGSLEFFRETQDLIERIIGNGSDLVLLKRDLHTLKGNTAVFGLATVSTLCHEAETQLADGASRVDCSRITSQWETTCWKLRHLLSDRIRNGIEVDQTEYACVLEALRSGVDRERVARMVAAWRLEPLRARLERAGEQLLATASRLGKGTVEVAVESPRIYLGHDDLSEFWSAFTHVVRNAAAHGLEPAEERARRGKSSVARFVLRAGVARQRLFIEVEDTGPGIDWDALRARASERGLPCATEADLKNALFADGVSTARAITESSGRGVGLSAVRSACERHHGTVDVTSTRGEGTKFRFSWPRERLENLVEFELGAAT